MSDRYGAVERAARQAGLSVLGGFYPDADDALSETCQTVLLLGPHEPGFWAYVRRQREFDDGLPDPLDRWSVRTVDALAATFGGEAIYPFRGPPYWPFFDWAIRTGRAWQSPVGMLVHDHAGLMVSFRGALALPDILTLDNVAPSPCTRCPDQPCRTACPVDALGAQHYDLDACHGFLDTADGGACMAQGCAARRACPVSQNYGRVVEQSAYHMSLFHR